MGIKMTHSGSLGMPHSITVSEDVLKHSKASDAKEALQLAQRLKTKVKQLGDNWYNSEGIKFINACIAMTQMQSENYKEYTIKEIDDYAKKADLKSLQNLENNLDPKKCIKTDVKVDINLSKQR